MRKSCDKTFKRKVTLEAMKEQMSLAELSQKYEGYQTVTSLWESSGTGC
jgi:hypothetical protein